MTQSLERNSGISNDEKMLQTAGIGDLTYVYKYTDYVPPDNAKNVVTAGIYPNAGSGITARLKPAL